MQAEFEIGRHAQDAVKNYLSKVRSGSLTWREVAERKAKRVRLNPDRLEDFIAVVERLGRNKQFQTAVVHDMTPSGAHPVGKRRITRGTRYR